MLQSGQPPQGRRERHQPRVADGGVGQPEALQPRHRASAQGVGERRGVDVGHVASADLQPGHGRQRACAQPFRQMMQAVLDEALPALESEDQVLERWQHRAQPAKPRQICDKELQEKALDLPDDLPCLAQLPAAQRSHKGAQCCGCLMVGPQLLAQRLRGRSQKGAYAAEIHGDARLERVAQLAEDDAHLVAAEQRERGHALYLCDRLARDRALFRG